ncbi:MAG TPA: permease-like cell division protein FtsX [Oscillospiraceae bacterium]|nr:permease-like cell division protein FtsX [Oscillospiraceae bacterium]HPS75513.1 permease-like cell division protein FtsX [Oscillospiraceae bacterium]
MNKSGYLIREGFRSIRTHRFMSFASVTIIMACLLIMGSFSLVAVNINSLIKDLESQNEIVAFVNEDYSQSQAKALQPKIEAVDNVASAEFVSREQAMKNFMADYSKDQMEGIDESVFRDRYVIHLTDISLMAQTKTALESVTGVAKVNAHVDYANDMITVRNIVSVVTLVLIVILVIVSFFIMTNTIKLATFSRREEIAIMKMVGATNGFIRLPFVVEGLVLGLMGGVLAFFAEWGLYSLVTGKIMETIAGNFVEVVPFASVATPVLLVFLGVGILVGAFGGVNAIRNYLKV